MKKVFISFILLFLLFINLMCSETQEVLYLNSYSKGYAWSDSITNGIEKTLSGQNISLHTEYMGSRFNSSEEYYRLLYKTFKMRYRHIDFDCIISSDNNALNFLRTYRDSLFSGIPLVFCGVNNFSNDLIEGMPLVTGVLEEIDMKKTIEAALKLQPNAKKIIAVSDKSQTGKDNTNIFLEDYKSFSNKIDMVLYDTLSFKELETALSQEKDEYFIVLLAYFVTKEGESIDILNAIKKIDEYSKYPIYTNWDFFADSEVLGGFWTNGFGQGKKAGELALKVLEGKNIESIPIHTVSPNQYVFDYEILKKYNLDEKNLPAEAIIRNKPDKTVKIPEKWLWSLFYIVLASAGLISIFYYQLRKKHELAEKLKEKEIFLKNLIRNIPGCVYMLNRRGELLYISDNAVEQSGYSRKDFKEDKHFWHKIIVSADSEDLFRKILKWNNPYPYINEVKIKNAEGKYMWFQDIGNWVYDHSGEKEKFIGFAFDKTESKNLESRLSEQKNLLENIINTIPDILVVKDKDRKVVLVNDSFEEIMKINKKDILGRDDCYVYSGELKDECIEQDLEVLDGKIISKTDFFDYNQRYYHFMKVPLRNSEGDINGIIVLARDVTEIKQAEEKYRMIAENVSDVIWTADLDGKITYIGPSDYKNRGFKEEEVLNTNLFDWVHPDERDEMKAESTKYAESFQKYGEPAYVVKRLRLLKSDGTYCWNEISSQIIRDEKGYLIGFAGVTRNIDEKIKTEERLKKSEAKYRMLFNNLQTGFVVMEPEYNSEGEIENFIFVNANEQYRKAFNLKNQDISGKRLDEVFPDIRKESFNWIKAYRNVVLTKEKMNIEKYSETWKKWYYVSAYSDEQSYLYILVDDVTEIKETEEDKQFFFEMSLDFYAISDFDLYFRSYNQKWTDVLGWSDKEFQAKKPFELFHPEDIELVKTKVELLFKGETVENVNARFRCKDGSYRCLSWKAAPFFTRKSIFIAAADITEKLEMEKELRESETRFHELSENIEEVFWIRRGEEFEYISPSYRDIWEIQEDPGEIGKEIFFNTVYSDDKELVRNTFKESIKTGKADYQYRIITQKGNMKWIHTKAFPIRDNRGNLIKIVGISDDITEIKKYEEELKRERENAEEAQKTAEEANRMKSRFLANMSHEIRTPLSGLMGMIDLIDRTDLTPVQTDYLRMIKISSSSLLSIINDILDFSKIEAGKIDIESIPFEFADIIEAVVKPYELRTKEKTVKFEIDIDDKIPEYLVGDPLRLKQIFMNLLSNAYKFTEKGKISFSAVLKEENPFSSSVSIEFRIKDTGIGISENKLNRIFEAFEQESESTSRKYGGSGLGLAITKKLVELMKGSISVESEVGKGSEFIIETEFKIAGIDAVYLLKKEKKNLDFNENCKSLNILLAEDNYINRRHLETILSMYSHSVTAVDNGRKVIDLFEKNDYDCIILDIHMPVMDGIETAYELRRTDRGRSIPIVALTAAALKGDKERFLNAGMDYYISKPVREEKLLSVLADISERNEDSEDDEEIIKKRRDLKHFDSLSLINREKFLKMFGSEHKELALELVQYFDDNYLTIIEFMEKSVELKKFSKAGELAHKLKGMTSHFGGVLIPEICREIEDLSGKENSEEILRLCGLIRMKASDFSEELFDLAKSI